MLISFSIENWQCFREKTVFSMVAGREKQHQDRIANIDKYDFGVLPVSAIYGGNASGKTKFFNALAFAQRFVTKVTQPESSIPREYFKLDIECALKPSIFTFELFLNEFCYEFSFAVTSEKVVEEKLVKILSASEKVLYQRRDGKIEFPDDPTLKKDERLKFVAAGTRDNQLFLTNAIDQKIEINYFQAVYGWFKHSLTLIGPNSNFPDLSEFFENSEMGDLLSQLDTGIAQLVTKEIPLESIGILEHVKTRMMGDLPEGAIGRVNILNSDEPILIKKKDGAITAKKLISYHKSFEGETIQFNWQDESHGTQRLINILPYFWDLWQKKSKKLYVIDELDRCLHTLLTRSLLDRYLASCSTETRSQLIFTTHDVALMDQDLFRRDELWVAERDDAGCGSLISFGEYKDVRADKDIRKSYLQGRLGGIPNIFLE